VFLSSHTAAFFGAFPASFSAGFTVRVVICVFFALSRTGFTSFGADFHERCHKLRTARCQSTAKGAEIGAVAAEFDTGRHVVAFAVFIAHFQAGSGAGFTGFGAAKTGIDVLG
jgi:hypothetical protein